MASSQGELTLVFETCTLRQQSMSMPSRLVSIFRLSMVKLSTPVARMPKCPPCRIEKSRSVTLRQFFRLMDLLPTPGSSACRSRPGAFAQAFAPDQSRAEDGDVVQILAPDQAVVQVAVAVVLILVPLVGLGRIVAVPAPDPATVDRRPTAGAFAQVQRDIALEADRMAQVASGGKYHTASAGICCRVDGLVDGSGVERFAIAFRAEGPYIKCARRFVSECGNGACTHQIYKLRYDAPPCHCASPPRNTVSDQAESAGAIRSW